MANHSTDESEFCRKLLMLGRWHATRRGLTVEDAEDCAVEFTLYVLTLLQCSEGEEESKVMSAAQDSTWLHQRARTHTRNFQRAVLTHTSRYSSLTPAGVVEEQIDSPSAGVDTALLQREFWGNIRTAFDSLDTIPRQLLIGQQIRGETTQALAAACGRSKHAVEQALVRSRQKMKRTLERHGCGELVMREYIAAFV